MTDLEFAKGHGAGNDFILFTDADGAIPLTPDLARRLCDRREGIGADGVIRAVRSRAVTDGAAVLAEEPLAEWFLDHLTAAGARAGVCGNAIRVFADYLIAEGLITPERRDTIPIGTPYGVRDVLTGFSGYSVDLGRWRLGPEQTVSAHGLDIARPGQTIRLGGEYVVVALASVRELRALELNGEGDVYSRSGSKDGAVADGDPVTTVFVVPEEPLLKNGVARVHTRVHETGVGELRSSGTGAAAASLAFRHWGGVDMPHSWSVEAPGGRLTVRMFPTEEGEHVAISGPAEIVYRGSIQV